jgi:hypothetical protein
MNPEDLVKTYLLTLTAITALVSTRIYVDEAPSQVRGDCIVVRRVGGDDISEGLIMARPLVQVSCFSREKSNSKAIASAVITAIGNYSGLMGTTFVVSRYQSDQVFRDNGWWHAPVDVMLRYQF